MGDITNILGGAFHSYEPKEAAPTLDQIRDAMTSAGITPPDNIILDGEIHRFKSSPKDKDKAGWYVFYDGSLPAGSFGCWREGIECNFRANTGRELSAAEEMAYARYIREAKLKKQADRERQHTVAASTVKQIWDNAASATPDHPYLQKKGIQPHNARVTGDGRLVVPMFSEDGKLSSLQYISADSKKLNHKGAETKAKFWRIGSTELSDKIYLAEGFATAATIYEEMHAACFISYGSSNFVNVAPILQDQYPNHQLIIVADNDESGTGQRYAEKCAEIYGARYVMPPNLGEDANDYKQAGHDLRALLEPPQDDWLIAADDFCSQPAPLKWLVKGWLQDKSLMMLHGPSGGGKTFVILDMALRIASDLPEWCGHKVTPGGVVYLAGEGHHGLRGRIAAWKQTHAPDQHLKMWLSKSGLDLNTNEGFQRVVNTISTLPEPPKLIIVDTLHRFLKGNESDTQDTKTMLDACSRLIEQFNCAVLLVHHTGLAEDAQHRARGSSAWRGALDIEINISPGNGDNPLKIQQMKSKDTELQEPIFAHLEPIQINGWFDDDQEPVTSAVLQQSDYEPTTDKKDSKLAKHQKMFSEAWLAMGKEVVNDKPYITKSALEHFLVENMGLSQSSAKVYCKPSADGRLINSLISGGIISVCQHGWVVDCNLMSSALLVQR